MRIVCAWCGREQVGSSNRAGDAISHAMCPACGVLVARSGGIDNLTDAEKLEMFNSFWWGGESAKVLPKWKAYAASGELAAGIEEELEHVDDERVAAKIALDHLVEDEHYYEKLKAAGL